MRADEVHEAARAVLRFWLEETPPEARFARDAALDAAIGARFGDLYERIVATRATGWGERADTLLAAVVVLDQFGRNLFRGTARAFAADALARELTGTALRAGWDGGMNTVERQFLYLPLMHSEDAGDQVESMQLFEELGDAAVLAFARDHHDVIARYGRFPSRNAALGRVSTAEEVAYLSRPDAGW